MTKAFRTCALMLGISLIGIALAGQARSADPAEPGETIGLVAFCELTERNLSLMRTTHRTPGSDTYRKVVTNPNTTCIDVRLFENTSLMPAMHIRRLERFRLPSGICIAYNIAVDPSGAEVFYWAPADGCEQPV